MRVNRLGSWLSLGIIACSVSGCLPPASKPAPVAEVDPDIVIMKGQGGKPSSSSTLGVKPMSFEQLGKCAVNITLLNQHAVQLKTQIASIDKRKIVVEKTNQALEAERANVNSKNPKAVNDYNNRIKLNDDVASYNQKSNKNNEVVNDFNTNCANRAYRQSDYQKLGQELQIALTTHSEASEVPIAEDVPNSNPVSAPTKVHISGSNGR